MPTPPRRGPGRPRKMPADVQRAAVLAAGREVFARLDFAATTVEEIAARAGVRRQAVYEQFGDKHALYEAVVEATAGEAMAAFGRAEEDGEHGGDGPWRDTHRYVARCCAYCIEHPAAVALLKRAIRTRGPRHAGLRARLAAGFSSAIRAGAPRPDRPPERSAELLVALLLAMSDAANTMSWAGAPPERDAVTDLVAEFVTGGLARLLTGADRTEA